MAFHNVSGPLVQGCDFRNIDAASSISSTLGNSFLVGAIFDDADEEAWANAKR
jgi:hypothetical protein